LVRAYRGALSEAWQALALKPNESARQSMQRRGKIWLTFKATKMRLSRGASGSQCSRSSCPSPTSSDLHTPLSCSSCAFCVRLSQRRWPVVEKTFVECLSAVSRLLSLCLPSIHSRLHVIIVLHRLRTILPSGPLACSYSLL
jgi:hypothetical protein